jgi:glyoxylase-like metal-dependent hydrolase (beta-lactamase superfamily II)
MGIGGAGLAASTLPGWALKPARAQAGATAGTVVVLKKGGVTLHTYMAPDGSALVTSHIIETDKRLIVVDAQFLQTFAKEARAYADSVGKPIERLILSHQHPDHWSGANQFGGVPFVATKAVSEAVKADIDAGGVQQRAGLVGASEVPADPRIPEGTLTEGQEDIDGVTLMYKIVSSAEAPEQVVIQVPQARTIIAQDLVFNNTYLFPLVDIPGWIKALEDLRGMKADYDTVLCGHGLPASMGEVDEGLDYLKFMAETFATAKTAEEATAALVQRYPSYGGAFILSFVANVYQNR